MLVFALWRIPRLQTMLLRNFSANPAGRKSTMQYFSRTSSNFIWIVFFSAAPCRSMLLSTFSHYSFFHIFANMYVLNSFSNGVCMALGKEQTLALYLSAGVVASFASYIHKVYAGVSGASLGAVSCKCLRHSWLNAFVLLIDCYFPVRSDSWHFGVCVHAISRHSATNHVFANVPILGG